MNTGTLGVHFIGSSANCSRDRAIARVKQLQSQFTVSVNDPQFCKMVQDVGGMPIHRVYAPEQGWNDDGAPFDHFTGKAYIEHLHAELVAWGVTNALYYLGNEVGNTNLPKLMAWALDGLNTANTFGGKVVALNIAWRNWSMTDWDALAPLLNAVREGGHYIGVHEGLSPEFPTVKEAYPEAVGRFVAMQQKYGVKVIVTEFAYSVSSDKGWIPDGLSGKDYAARSRECVAQVYAPHGAGVCFFTGCVWDRGVGFETLFDDALNAENAQTNAMFPVKESPVVQPPTVYPVGSNPQAMTVANTGVRLRLQPSLTAAIVRPLTLGEAVTVYGAPSANRDTFDWQRVTTAKGETGWSAMIINGVHSFAPVNVPPAETNRVVIDSKYLAYASEFGWEAGWTALCGETSLFMLLAYDRLMKHVALPPEITPLTIAHYLGKGAKDFSTLLELDKSADAYGIPLHLDTGLWSDPLSLFKAEIDAQRPVIALLDYSKLPTRWDQNFAGGHILVVVGYSDPSILCHDPDSPDAAHGAFVAYPRADFLAAWSVLGSTALVITP